MESLNMVQAYVDARLSDDPGAPVVRLRTTAEMVDGYTVLLAECKAEFERLSESYRDGGFGAGDAGRIAKLWKRIIRGCYGKAKYREVVRWLTDGEDMPAESLNALLTPLVTWTIAEIMAMARPDAVAEVLDGIEQEGVGA